MDTATSAVSSMVPEDGDARPASLLSNPNYAAMTQSYGGLGQLPFGAQQSCIMSSAYATGAPRLEGLQDLTAYQTSVNAAHMAQYQAAQALASASSFSSDPTAKILKSRSIYGLNGVNPGQRHGRWSEDEHQQFLTLMQKYGRSWTKISQVMMTRSEPQVRSHAQKHFLRISRLEKQPTGSDCKDKEKKLGTLPSASKHSADSTLVVGSVHEEDLPVAPQLSSDETALDEKSNKQKRAKRRRVLNNAYGHVAANLGMFGTVPDAAALVTMAAQAAAVHVQPPTSEHSAKHIPQLNGVPQVLLQQTLALQQHHQQDQVQDQEQLQSLQSTQALPGASYGSAFLPSIQTPYTLQQLHQASAQQLHHAQGMGHTGYYNYMPFTVRPESSIGSPSWNNMAVATSLGMVTPQAPWILPVTQVTAGAVLSPTGGGLAHVSCGYTPDPACPTQPQSSSETAEATASPSVCGASLSSHAAVFGRNSELVNTQNSNRMMADRDSLLTSRTPTSGMCVPMSREYASNESHELQTPASTAMPAEEHRLTTARLGNDDTVQDKNHGINKSATCTISSHSSGLCPQKQSHTAGVGYDARPQSSQADASVACAVLGSEMV